MRALRRRSVQEVCNCIGLEQLYRQTAPMATFLKIRSKTAEENSSTAEKQAFSSDRTQTSPTEPSAPIGQNRKILVADDNSIVLKAFELKLKASGFEVSTASSA